MRDAPPEEAGVECEGGVQEVYVLSFGVGTSGENG